MSNRFIISPNIFGHYRLVREDIAYLERENILEGKPTDMYAKSGIFFRRDEIDEIIEALTKLKEAKHV